MAKERLMDSPLADILRYAPDEAYEWYECPDCGSETEWHQELSAPKCATEGCSARMVPQDL